MSNFKDVYDTSVAGFQSAIMEEQHAFQQATLTGNLDEQVRASQALASLRSTLKEYDSMAREHAASIRQSAPANRYGLNQTEAEIARKSRLDLPAQQAEELYARNRHKLQTMRQTGAYRDDQGRR